MEAQFIVSVTGNWHYNFKPATVRTAEKELREAVKDRFEFLAQRTSVKRADNRIYEIASRRAMALDDIETLLHAAKKQPDATWLIEQMGKALSAHKRRMSELPGTNPTL